MSDRDVPVSVARPMPPTLRDPDPLVEDLADLFVRIETNYLREGTGHGSRFAGERLEVVQARAALRYIRGASRAARVGICPVPACGRRIGITKHGQVATHYQGGTDPPIRCPGGGRLPAGTDTTDTTDAGR